jgi:hypothetical protein
MSEARFCKDCRFAKKYAGHDEYWECLHPSSLVVPEMNLVTGVVPRPRQLSCLHARYSIGKIQRCDPEGRFWEARD